jgi:hypothetical protein
MDNLSFNTLLPEDFDEEGGEEFSFSLNFFALLGVDIEEGLLSSTSFNLHRLLGVSRDTSILGEVRTVEIPGPTQ